MPSSRIITFALLMALTVAAPQLAAAAGEQVGQPPAVEETIEVERAKTKEPKHATLRFLKDNRVFIRAQLDLLRLQITERRSGGAELLDARYLRLKEMAAEIAAARDTVRSEHELTASRELLMSVAELAELEGQLSLMDTLLADQRERLLEIEGDFLGHQETALVVLVKGFSGGRAPEFIVLSEENEEVRVALGPNERSSLERGGIAQIYHEFVEPRTHTFEVGFEGEGWSGAAPGRVSVEAERDRLTFLELDLSGLDRSRENLGLLTSVWVR
jgi:hypothetical protein